MEFTRSTLENWGLVYRNLLQHYPFNHVLVSPFNGVREHDPFHAKRELWSAWLAENVDPEDVKVDEEAAEFRFRNKRSASLFKMTWGGSSKGTGTKVGGIY